jgi:hypothetical protein
MHRRLAVPLAAASLLFLRAGDARGQTLVPAPTDPLPVITDVPPTAVPTEAPAQPTTTPVPPPEPTSLPETDRPRRDEQAPQPTEPPSPQPGVPAPPFRTQRPTRTARAITPTATALSSAALRITLHAEPSVLSRGQPVIARVEVLNQSPYETGQILVEVALPAGLQLEAASPLSGSADASGNLIQWTIPALDSGAMTRVTMRALVLAVDQSMALCASVLSSGSPVESCIGLVPGSGSGNADLDAVPAFVMPEAPTDGGTPLEWALLLIGLLLLGLWGGTAYRSKIASSRTAPEGSEP